MLVSDVDAWMRWGCGVIQLCVSIGLGMCCGWSRRCLGWVLSVAWTLNQGSYITGVLTMWLLD